MQEGRKGIFDILQEKQFCSQISFVFHCFSTTYFFHIYANTLSWDRHYSKCVILPKLSICVKDSIPLKMSLTTFLHSHDEIRPNIWCFDVQNGLLHTRWEDTNGNVLRCFQNWAKCLECKLRVHQLIFQIMKLRKVEKKMRKWFKTVLE